MANDPLADAKKFLAESKDKFKPLTADKSAPASATPAKSAPMPSIAKELAVKKGMVDTARKGLEAPKMHDGGKVKEDGLHDLQKGEVVIPKDKVMKDKSGVIDGLMEAAEEKAEPKHGKKEEKSEKKSDKKHSGKPRFKHSHVVHHDNGSHTITHTGHPKEDGSPAEEMSYAVPDMEGVKQGMEQNVSGEPAPGEAAAGAEGTGPAAS